MTSQSLRLDEPPRVLPPSSAMSVGHRPFPAETRLKSSESGSSNGQLLRFIPLSTTPPFVYRIIEPPPPENPLFALTLQSCGKLVQQPPLGNTRLLFSGMGEVQVVPAGEISVDTERIPLQAANARLEGERVFLRVLSVTTPDCLTDFIIWSAGEKRLTERATAAIKQLLLMHHHHIHVPLTGDVSPPR